MTTTHYIDGFQYTEDKLDFFPHAEGYVKVTHASSGGIGGGATNYNYVFNYTDYLGNIRLRYAINPVNQWLEILEEDHYYPFGLKHNGYNAQNYVFMSLGGGPVELIPTNPNVLESYKYKFNGMEWQSEMGLDYYDFGARNYDPALGRWMNVDPLAEKFYDRSPYEYCFSNPLRYIDPTGMSGEEWRNKDNQLVYDPTLNGGKGDYTEHATDKEKELGNSLQSTKQGRKQFDKLVNSEQKTTVIINETDKPVTKGGDLILGKTQPENLKDSDNNNSTITIYTENIKDFISDIEAGVKGGYEAHYPLNSGKDLDISNLKEPQLKAAVFGEEIEHSTKSNIKLQREGAPLQKIEKIPGKVSDNILKQSLK